MPAQLEDPRFSGRVLELRGVAKRYPGVVALDRVDLTLDAGEVLGVAGENGAGKSTLISIVNGTVTPSSGEMFLRGQPHRFGNPRASGSAGIATVYQEQGLIPSLLVFENMFLGREARFARAGTLPVARMRRRAQAILDELGCSIDAAAHTGSLAFGDRQVVEIAKAFAAYELTGINPIILLDEPTSGLSEDETDVLLENIRNWRTRASFVFISHRLTHLFQVAGRIMVLKDGRHVGTVDAAATDEEHLHELIVGRKRDSEYYREALQLRPGSEVALRTDGLTMAGRFADVGISVRVGEIVGLAGVQGCGKTELVRALAGMERYDSGRLELLGRSLGSGRLNAAIRRGVAYIPAERLREGIIAENSVEFNLTLPRLSTLRAWPAGPLSLRRCIRLTASWIERLSIKTGGPRSPMRTMSGGNQQKVVFGKWLSGGVKVLLLDDPGRGLDVGAKEDIYELLRGLCADGVSIVLVSDNLPELIGLSHRIYTMRGGRVTNVIEAPRDGKPSEAAVVASMV